MTTTKTNSQHVVLRKDVSTNTMLPKKELIRIVKNKDGEIFIDNDGKANGRGVYMKPTMEALQKVKKNKSLERGLKTKINPDIYELIESEIRDNWD